MLTNSIEKPKLRTLSALREAVIYELVFQTLLCPAVTIDPVTYKHPNSTTDNDILKYWGI